MRVLLALVTLAASMHAVTALAETELCVRNMAEFNSGWVAAQDGPVTVKLAEGSFDFAQFNPSGISYRFRVQGGYNSTCSSRTENPGATVITHGGGGDIRISPYVGTSGASLEFERVTFRAASGVLLFLENINSDDQYVLLDRVWVDQTGSFRVQSGAEVFVRNSVFTRNSGCALSVAVGSASTYSWFEKAVISNSTFADNAGGGLCIGGDNVEEDWQLFLTNSVFWNNTTFDIGLRNLDQSLTTLDAVLRNNTYTAIQSNRALRTTPIATSTANPQFVNAAAGNWRLSGGSPAINSGRINSNLLGQRDFDGAQRWFGEAPDRGAFESNIGSTATVLTVTNTNDAGIGSLRQALIDANAAPNLNEIRFNISGACPRTITLASLLPDIVQPVRIDGYSQPGASRNTAVLGWNANLCIVLNGANQITGAYGFNVNTGASPDATVSIEGIAFSGHSFAAAQFIAGRDHRFVGNQIGGVVGSTTLIASSTGVRIGGSVEGVRVGGPEPGDRNVIANTLGIGVNISGSGSTQPFGAVVENNYIGTQSGGDVRGGQRGVFIAGADHLIRGNVIANASSHGVELSGSLATGNRITGNRIGVPAVCSGNCIDRGNGGHGVLIRNSADENRIESNLIAHSGLDGIAVTGARRNSLRRNTMYDQSGIGIDLGDDGRNLFDVNNSVAAPIEAGNDSQNAPSLSSVAGTAATGLPAGALTSANGWYRIDFYGIPSTTGCTLAFAPGPTPAGFFGEGRDWLGSTFLQISNGTNISDGSASFSEVELQREGSSSYFVAGSTWINATATRLSGPPLTGAYSHRGTSEFGRCRQYAAGSVGGPIFANGFEGS
jgi:parallel beta-helix repeat protein